MDSTVTIALITVAVPSVLAAIATPIVVAMVQARNKRLEAKLTAEALKIEKATEAEARIADREAEWRRADLLETRATARAEAVARRAEESAALLVKTTLDVRDLAITIDGKADEIHALTNSSYTAALQATLEAVQAKLVVLLGDVTFKHNNNLEVNPEALADIAATRKKMNELTAAISERLRQDVLAKEEKAKELLVGKQQHQANTTRDQPIPVADDRTATATERTATASERVADAAERTADLAANK